MVGASFDAAELASPVDGIEHQPEIMRHRRGRDEGGYDDVGVVELRVFHKAKAESFVEPFRVAERIISIECHVIDAPRARSSGNVVLRSIGHLWSEFGRRDIALRFPKHLVKLAARSAELIGWAMTDCRFLPAYSAASRLQPLDASVEFLGPLGPPSRVRDRRHRAFRQLQ